MDKAPPKSAHLLKQAGRIWGSVQELISVQAPLSLKKGEATKFAPPALWPFSPVWQKARPMVKINIVSMGFKELKLPVSPGKMTPSMPITMPDVNLSERMNFQMSPS